MKLGAFIGCSYICSLPLQRGSETFTLECKQIFSGEERERSLPFLHYPRVKKKKNGAKKSFFKKNGASGGESIISPEQYTVCHFQVMFVFQTLNAMMFPDFLRVIINY